MSAVVQSICSAGGGGSGSAPGPRTPMNEHPAIMTSSARVICSPPAARSAGTGRPSCRRVVLADPDVVALALRVAAADLRRAAPHDLREVAGLHREAAVGELVVLDLVVPHGDGRLGIEHALGPRREVLAVLAAAVAEHAALRLERVGPRLRDARELAATRSAEARSAWRGRGCGRRRSAAAIVPAAPAAAGAGSAAGAGAVAGAGAGTGSADGGGCPPGCAYIGPHAASTTTSDRMPRS